MQKKERFAILSRCTTLQSLQSFKNEQVKSLTDDFKEPEVRHILITQADANAVKTDRVLVSVQRDAGMPILPLTPEEEDELADTVFGYRLIALVMNFVKGNRSKDVGTRRSIRQIVQGIIQLAHVQLSEEDQRILDASDDELLEKIEQILSEADQKVVNLLTPIFKNDAQCARRYFESIRGLNSTQLINVTNEYVRAQKITTGANHKTLWKVLSNAQLITTGERNWNTKIADQKH